MWHRSSAAAPLAAAVIVFLAVSPAVAGAVATCPDGMPVFGYLPEWRYLQWTAAEHAYRWRALGEHVTHLVLFSLEVGAGGGGEADDGWFAATDRFPPSATLAAAHAARRDTGVRLLLSFGGNSRTGGFPQMVATKERRHSFVAALRRFLARHGLDGVDYNWEYPRTPADWEGLRLLVEATREGLPAGAAVTVAYYPDGRQERYMARMAGDVDFFLAMSYDAPGLHSPRSLAEETVSRAAAAGLPLAQVALGLPFYSRHVHTGEWRTYEQLCEEDSGCPAASLDQVGPHYYNGADTIGWKVGLALEKGVGGLMVWEVGQDAFDNAGQGMHPRALLRAVSEARGCGSGSGSEGEL